MSKDLFHGSVLQFRNWAENQPGLSGRTWAEIFDFKKVEEVYLERWNSLTSDENKLDNWYAETRDNQLSQIRSGDPLGVIPLYRIIFHETGLIDAQELEANENEEREEKIALMNLLSRVCVQDGKDFFLNAIREEWKKFHRVTDSKILSEIQENDQGISVKSISRTWFDSGEIIDKVYGYGIEQYYQCARSFEAWQNVMGDSLDSVWRKEKDLDETQLLSTDDGVLVKLTNGKMFVISSSEWGSIDPLFVIGPQDKPITEPQEEVGFKP